VDGELTPLDTSLAVLAGGEGSRMGRHKAGLQIHGQPILEYLLDRISWPGPVMLITAPGREHPPGHERFDFEWVDPVTGEGPLRGLLTALEHLRTPLLVVATVDMPGVGREHVEWLVSHLRKDESLIGVMASRRADDCDFIEPFPIALRSAAEGVIRRRLERGRGSVHDLLEERQMKAVPAPASWPPPVWTNLNRPEDVQAFERNST